MERKIENGIGENDVILVDDLKKELEKLRIDRSELKQELMVSLSESVKINYYF